MKKDRIGSNDSASILGRGILLVLLLGTLSGCAGSISKNFVLSHSFTEPLGSTTTAKADINARTGNLTIDKLVGSEGVLVNGILEYVKNLGLPIRSMSTTNGLATFTINPSEKRQPWYLAPWHAFDRAVDWWVYFNPAVPLDLKVYSGGGHLKLNLGGMAITKISAETSGGNVNVTLPEDAANLTVMAKSGGGGVTVEIGRGMSGNNFIQAQSGGGNVMVQLPDDLAARIIATSGMGKITVDPRFVKLDEKTYQSPNFTDAADRVEITLSSGAGNVTVGTK